MDPEYNIGPNQAWQVIHFQSGPGLLAGYGPVVRLLLTLDPPIGSTSPDRQEVDLLLSVDLALRLSLSIQDIAQRAPENWDRSS